jgi:hypothetical protein
MILTPAIGWSQGMRIRAASAGGQEEHPSEVNTARRARAHAWCPPLRQWPARDATTATRSAFQAGRLWHPHPLPSALGALIIAEVLLGRLGEACVVLDGR